MFVGQCVSTASYIILAFLCPSGMHACVIYTLPLTISLMLRATCAMFEELRPLPGNPSASRRLITYSEKNANAIDILPVDCR